MTFVRNVKTPTLLLQGEDDTTDPIGQSQQFARIAVTDTGDGIPLDMQPHLFEPFFTTKDPSKGTGPGLSIVYSIAKEAGGTVSFATADGNGATFEVLLPLAGG